MNETLIEARHIAKYYRDGNVQALNGVSLAVGPAEFVVIRGPSGCGKSTLLHILAGLDRPTSGEVFFEGRSLMESLRQPGFRARTFGVVFQAFYLWPSLNVLDNVLLPLGAGGIQRRSRRKEALSLLEMVGIIDKARAGVRMLSVGQRQRVAIARALIAGPKVILADEPTGNLDSKNARNILGLLQRINQEKKVTIIMVTHQKAAEIGSPRVVEMLDGAIRQS